jgi:hypothetical protein
MSVAAIVTAVSTSAILGQVAQQDCKWSGPSEKWILARHPPQGDMSGPLGAKIFLFLHEHSIPISFISKSSGDPYIRLRVGPETTLAEMLEEIERQAPGYRLGIVGGRAVFYPGDAEYDARVNVNSMGDITRGQALYPLLRQLRADVSVLHGLDMPVLRGAGKSIYGSRVSTGGNLSVVEHLVSLLGNEPFVTFRLVAKESGRLSFLLDWTPLMEKIAIQAPPTVKIGETFRAVVKGSLADGTVVTLEGSGCGIEWSVSGEGVLSIDSQGQVVALKKGVKAIVAHYEDVFARAEIHVQ